MSTEEAPAAIKKIHIYKEQQAEGSPAIIHDFEWHERHAVSEVELQCQGDIESYFSCRQAPLGQDSYMPLL